jgi:hypothetical protein
VIATPGPRAVVSGPATSGRRHPPAVAAACPHSDIQSRSAADHELPDASMAPPKPPDLPDEIIIQHLGSHRTHAQPKTTEINRLHPTSRSRTDHQTGIAITGQILTPHLRLQTDHSTDTFPVRQAPSCVSRCGAICSKPGTIRRGGGPGEGTARAPPPARPPIIHPPSHPDSHLHPRPPKETQPINRIFERPPLPNHSNHPDQRRRRK